MSLTRRRRGCWVVGLLCLFGAAVLFFVLLSCSKVPEGCTAYPAGLLTIYVCDWTSVSRECAARGTPGEDLRGCYSPSTREIFTTKNWLVLMHEVCHYTLFVSGDPEWSAHDEKHCPHVSGAGAELFPVGG